MNRKRSLELGDINSQETDYEMPTQETKATKRDYTFRVREQIMPKELSPGRQYFKILSWNVNGLRSLATVNRKRLILLVEKHKPDLICLQVNFIGKIERMPIQVPHTQKLYFIGNKNTRHCNS